MATGYNNADYAVILPDRSAQNAALGNQLYERGEKRRLEQERAQKEQQQRADTLAKYVGDQFDDPHYLTGTSYDPVINNKLAETKQKYADIIRKNPGASLADIQFQLSKDIGTINNLSSTIKNVRTNVDAQTSEFDKLKGIDGKAVKLLALNSFLYKTDPKTGQKTLRDTSELDPTKDYVGEVMKNHPEVYLNEGQAMDAALKEYPTIGVGNTVSTAFAGRRRTTEYDGKLYPFQQIKRDANGKEIPDETGRAQYGLRSQPAMIDGQPVTLNGKPLEIMDNDVYSHWVSNPANNAILIKDLNSFNAQQRAKKQPQIPDGTPEADMLKSHFLFQRLQNIPAPDFKHKDKTTEASFLEKQQAGYSPASIANAAAKGVASALKENQKLQGTEIGVLLRGAALDKSILEGATTDTVNGKTMYNILNTIGDLKLGFNSKHEPVYAKALYVDPANPGAITVKDANDIVTTYQGKTLRGFAKRIAAHNGGSVDKTEKLLNEVMDSNGNFKNVDQDAAMQAKIQERIQKKKTFSQALNPFVK